MLAHQAGLGARPPSFSAPHSLSAELRKSQQPDLFIYQSVMSADDAFEAPFSYLCLAKKHCASWSFIPFDLGAVIFTSAAEALAQASI